MYTLLRTSLEDIISGFRAHTIWLKFGWLDIKLKYRRSFLGPFWITLSLGFMILVMGTLYSYLFQQKIEDYMPFIGVSLTVWFFLAGLINDECLAFINSADQIMQTNQPITIYILRTLWRNLIAFFHNALFLLAVLIYFHRLSLEIFTFLFFFLLVCALFFFLSIIIALISVRFRDFPQIVGMIMQVMVFITPVFWKKEFLNAHQWVLHINPMNHLLEILRNPLLGNKIPLFSLQYLGCSFLILAIIAVILLGKYKNRVAYWI